MAFGFEFQSKPSDPLDNKRQVATRPYGFLSEDILSMIERHKKLPTAKKGVRGPEHDVLAEEPVREDTSTDAVETPAKKILRDVTRQDDIRPVARAPRRSKRHKPR